MLEFELGAFYIWAQVKSTHIEILKSELELRRARNPAYSLRSFGRDLGLAPSALSDLLQGKKGISSERASTLAEKIGLSEDERELFILSAQASHSRRQAEREKASTELKQRISLHRISEEELETASNWYHQALLELTELEECEHSAEWFARRLRLPLAAMESAIERLLALGWLKREKGKYRASSSTSLSSVDVPSQAVKQLHEQILCRASGALFSQGVKEREFITTGFAFDSSQIEEAKRDIRKFQRAFAEKYYAGSRRKNSVYQIAMQFFRLDQGEEK